MKISRGKPRYEQTFFRFLEYFAQVKTASLKRKTIANMALVKLCSFDIFSVYVESGSTMENLYLFYSRHKSHDFLKEFFSYRKLRAGGISQRKVYHKVSTTPYHKFYETKDWVSLSTKVKKIYGRKCMKCGVSDSIMHTDHVIPRSLDMSKELDINNLQVLCEFCNTEKSNLNCNDYRKSEDLLKLKAYLDKTTYVPSEITIKTWIDFNRSKLSKKQVDILVELWDKRLP